MDRLRPYLPFVSVIAGIAVFSLMDAAVKSAAIAVGAYSAILLRSAVGTLLALPLWIVPHRRQRRTLARNVMRLHMLRGVTVAVMAPLFFFGLVRIPLAEGIALSFIAPLIALYLASVMLGEQIRPTAIWASVIRRGAARPGISAVVMTMSCLAMCAETSSACAFWYSSDISVA